MTKSAIVVVHGFNSSPLFLKGIEYELKAWGKVDQILNLNLYGSKWWILPNEYNQATPIVNFVENTPVLEGSIVENVLQQLKAKLDPEVTSLAFLGHSMGGLVIRSLYKLVIAPNPTSWLDRLSPSIKVIIQLATPNNGSKLTNLKLVEVIDKLHSSYYLKFVGFSINLILKFTNLLGISEQENLELYPNDETSQIRQMTPGSKFLQWLNSPPTHCDVVPHYRMIGRRNIWMFTNLAWHDSNDNKTKNDLIVQLKEFEGMGNDEIIEEHIEHEELHDTELHQLQEYLSEIEGDRNDNISEQLPDLDMESFELDEVTPNDGLVSVKDAALEGSILISLDEYASKIDHHSICMWYLPFKPYKFVRDKVLEILEKEMS